MRVPLFAVVMSLALAGCGGEAQSSPTAPPKEAADEVYVGYLEKEGIIPTYGNVEDSVTLAHQICDRYERGDSFAAVVKTLMNNNIPAHEAGQISGAATAAYCPEYKTP